MVRIFGANNNSLTSYYPPKGFVGWHTNWNAFGYQLILTWSESGDGYFTYYDKKNDEFVKHEDVKGCSLGGIGLVVRMKKNTTVGTLHGLNVPRFTLAFKFPYGNLTERHDQAYDAIQDLIYDIENG